MKAVGTLLGLPLYQQVAVIFEHNQFSCQPSDKTSSQQSKQKNVPELRALVAEKLKEFSAEPRVQVKGNGRIVKDDLPFKKGGKQNFTDEILTNTKYPSFNPLTNNLTDNTGEVIQENFTRVYWTN